MNTFTFRKQMLSLWKAEIKTESGRATVRAWKVTGSFRRQIKALKKMARREERRERKRMK